MRRRVHTRRKRLAVLLLVAAGCGDGEPDALGPAPGTPVILVSLDTLRPDRTTPYGAPARNSPFLARLAEESVVFDDCIAQSSSTGPSHRTVFTGMFVHRHGQTRGLAMHSPFTLAGLLRHRGYATAGFNGGGYIHSRFGFDQGFDLYYSEDDPARERVSPSRGRRGFRQTLPQALEWYRGRAGGGPEAGPFFLFLHTYDVHCPYWPEKPWRQEFGSPYGGALDLSTTCGPQSFARAIEAQGGLTPADRRFVGEMYDGSIAMADELLADFLQVLRDDGVLDRALLVVFSDHGESLGEHNHLGHTLMWEEQLKVPLMIRFPGGARGGTRVAEPVMLADLLPTILDFLGEPLPPGVQGESLLPVITGHRSWRREDGGHERMRLSMQQRLMGVRFDERWKIAFLDHRSGPKNPALYDLAADPGETRNLCTTAAGREHFDRLFARFKAFKEETRAGDRRFASVLLENELGEDLEARLSELGYTGENAEPAEDEGEEKP